MRFSFMSFSCPELDLDAMLALAKRLGYEGVEPRLDSKHKHGVEVDADMKARAEIRAKFKASGIDCACLATSLVFANPATAAENVAAAFKRVDLAADIGCRRLRIFGGKIPAEVTREQAIDNVAAAMGEAAAYAERKGIVLCFETHDDWCDPEHVAAVVRKVDNPGLAVNWDIMHPVRAAKKTIDASFETLKPWIRHVHVHDGKHDEAGKLTLVPIGEGMIDHQRALTRLNEIHYDGFVSGEWIGWEPYETHLPRELATLKKFAAKK